VAITLQVHKSRRVVPLRWKRARHGDPHRHFPDVDDRGYRSTEFSPIVGILQGKEAVVRVERELVEDGAELFVTSSNTAKVSIVDPADGKLPATKIMDVKLKGVAGADPEEVQVAVRFGTKTGPVVARLLARCYTRRRVVVTPHVVTIAGPGGVGGVASTANVAAIMELVIAIWRHAGVEFQVGATVNDNVTFATAGILSDNPFPGEIATLLGTNHVPNTINAYFVPQIGTGGVLGYGFSRPSSVTFGTGNPGIILGDRTAAGDVHDTPWAGNDLAHECGHFFQLWHPNNQQPPKEREDTWARRMLMHNYNTQPKQKKQAWKDDTGYGQLNGFARRGCLITHKHIDHIATDNECATSRAAILAGPY
jgi:hypothetical protein